MIELYTNSEGITTLKLDGNDILLPDTKDVESIYRAIIFGKLDLNVSADFVNSALHCEQLTVSCGMDRLTIHNFTFNMAFNLIMGLCDIGNGIDYNDREVIDTNAGVYELSNPGCRNDQKYLPETKKFLEDMDNYIRFIRAKGATYNGDRKVQ